jgi:outer membrane protein assembly factor BamA
MIRRLLIITSLLWILPHETFATIKNEYLGDVTVHIEGATRTKEHYIEFLVKKCLEKEKYKSWESVDAGALGQCVSNSRLFKKVEVQVKQTEIDVTIAERWTLIPIPNFYATKGQRSAGAFIFETNFLGYGKTVGAGGAVSTTGNTFSLFYRDPTVNFSNYTLSVVANRSSNELDLYQGTEIVYGYTKKETGLSITPGYKVTPTLELSVLLNYADRRYEQLAAYAAPGDYWAYSAGVRASYANADYKLFYNDGVSVQISWLRQIHRSDKFADISQATIKFEWDKLMFKEHALQLALNAAYLANNGNVGNALMFGRVKGFRGIEPNGLWTREIAAASADYQIPVGKTKHGTFTVAPFMDYGVYKPFISGAGDNYLSYGIGGYLFINTINLPGVGLVFGRNERFMGDFAAFQIGFGFN